MLLSVLYRVVEESRSHNRISLRSRSEMVPRVLPHPFEHPNFNKRTLWQKIAILRPPARAAEVCNQKAEVDEGAGEGAEDLPTDFFNDLECFC